MRRQIHCEHNIPISECGTHYPIFLQETTVGDYLDNPLGFSNDTIMQGYQHTLLTLTLNHNASVVAQAAALISAGPIKPHHHKRAIEQFKRLHKEYSKDYEGVLKQAEAEFSDGR